jgi:hypothetical protein
MRVPRGSTITIDMEEAEDQTNLEVSWPGPSYDEHLLRFLEEGSPDVIDGEMLPMDGDMEALANLYRTPKEIFGMINVSGAPGSGATISFSLPRS